MSADDAHLRLAAQMYYQKSSRATRRAKGTDNDKLHQNPYTSTRRLLWVLYVFVMLDNAFPETRLHQYARSSGYLPCTTEGSDINGEFTQCRVITFVASKNSELQRNNTAFQRLSNPECLYFPLSLPLAQNECFRALLQFHEVLFETSLAVHSLSQSEPDFPVYTNVVDCMRHFTKNYTCIPRKQVSIWDLTHWIERVCTKKTVPSQDYREELITWFKSNIGSPFYLILVCCVVLPQLKPFFDLLIQCVKTLGNVKSTGIFVSGTKQVIDNSSKRRSFLTLQYILGFVLTLLFVADVEYSWTILLTHLLYQQKQKLNSHESVLVLQ